MSWRGPCRSPPGPRFRNLSGCPLALGVCSVSAHKRLLSRSAHPSSEAPSVARTAPTGAPTGAACCPGSPCSLRVVTRVFPVLSQCTAHSVRLQPSTLKSFHFFQGTIQYLIGGSEGRSSLLSISGQFVISWFVSFSPTSGSVLTAQSLQPTSHPLPNPHPQQPPTPHTPPSLSLSLKINKLKKKQKGGGASS